MNRNFCANGKNKNSSLQEKSLYQNMDCRYFSLDFKIHCNINIPKPSCVFAVKGTQPSCILDKNSLAIYIMFVWQFVALLLSLWHINKHKVKYANNVEREFCPQILL